jgi:hypothetical protein
MQAWRGDVTSAAERCTATANRTGKRCRRWPHRGTTVCDSHGAAAPHVRRKAAERVALERAEGLLTRYGDVVPMGNPYEVMQDVAGRVYRMCLALEDSVDELKDVRYRTEKAGEQLRGEVTAMFSGWNLLRQIATDAAKLGIEERLVRIGEGKIAAVLLVLNDGVKAAGLSEAQEFRLRQTVAAGLQRLDAP